MKTQRYLDVQPALASGGKRCRRNGPNGRDAGDDGRPQLLLYSGSLLTICLQHTCCRDAPAHGLIEHDPITMLLFMVVRSRPSGSSPSVSFKDCKTAAAPEGAQLVFIPPIFNLSALSISTFHKNDQYPLLGVTV